MVQPLLESKLALSSSAEAVPAPRQSPSSSVMSLEKLGATGLGDLAAAMWIRHTGEKRALQLENEKIVSLKCLLHRY